MKIGLILAGLALAQGMRMNVLQPHPASQDTESLTAIIRAQNEQIAAMRSQLYSQKLQTQNTAAAAIPQKQALLDEAFRSAKAAPKTVAPKTLATTAAKTTVDPAAAAPAAAPAAAATASAAAAGAGGELDPSSNSTNTTKFSTRPVIDYSPSPLTTLCCPVGQAHCPSGYPVCKPGPRCCLKEPCPAAMPKCEIPRMAGMSNTHGPCCSQAPCAVGTKKCLPVPVMEYRAPLQAVQKFGGVPQTVLTSPLPAGAMTAPVMEPPGSRGVILEIGAKAASTAPRTAPSGMVAAEMKDRPSNDYSTVTSFSNEASKGTVTASLIEAAASVKQDPEEHLTDHLLKVNGIAKGGLDYTSKGVAQSSLAPEIPVYDPLTGQVTGTGNSKFGFPPENVGNMVSPLTTGMYDRQKDMVTDGMYYRTSNEDVTTMPGDPSGLAGDITGAAAQTADAAHMSLPVASPIPIVQRAVTVKQFDGSAPRLTTASGKASDSGSLLQANESSKQQGDGSIKITNDDINAVAILMGA